MTESFASVIVLVDLLRTLLNPETGLLLERLQKVLPTHDNPRPIRRPSRHGPRRARHKLIEQTCLEVLETSSEALAIRVIHAKVEELLSTKVVYSSVKNVVARLAKSKQTGVQRVGPGIYSSANSLC